VYSGGFLNKHIYKLLSWRFVVSFAIIFALCFVAIFAELIAPVELLEANLKDRLCSISSQHILGCDVYGGDLFAQIIWGARTSLLVAFSVNIITAISGLVIGISSGFIGGWFDRIVMFFTEIFMAFPGILLVMAISSMLGSSIQTTIVALCVTGWTGVARIVRAEALKIRKLAHVKASISLGASQIWVLRHHVLPGVMVPLVICISFFMASTILVEASLTYLGFGVQDQPSWGMLISQGKSVILQAPYLSILPGVMVFLLVLSFNLLGDSLRDYLSPANMD
jgi:peptide/nickel transport system permease protein